MNQTRTITCAIGSRPGKRSAWHQVFGSLLRCAMLNQAVAHNSIQYTLCVRMELSGRTKTRLRSGEDGAPPLVCGGCRLQSGNLDRLYVGGRLALRPVLNIKADGLTFLQAFEAALRRFFKDGLGRWHKKTTAL